MSELTQESIDLQTCFDSYAEQKKQLESQLRINKGKFEVYLRNKSVPLMERWDTFSSAPDEIKNHLRSLPGHNQNKAMDILIDRMASVPEVYGRGKEIDMADFLENRELFYEGEFYPENLSQKSTEDDIINLLEWVLSKNIGSFKFDW